MHPQEKLKPQIDTLVSSMMLALRDAAPVHVKAVSRGALEDDTDPEGSALSGGSLKGEKPPPIRHNSSALVAAYRQFFKAAIAAGEPVHLIEFRFRRSDTGWTYDVSLETAAAHRTLEQSRPALDQEIAKAMVASVGNQGWTKIVLEQTVPSPAKLVAFLDRERQEVVPSPELVKLLERAFGFYAQHGRELLSPLWRVEGSREDYDVESEMYYR